MTEAQHDRLDRIYLENSSRPGQEGKTSGQSLAEEAEAEALEEELESLYSEIAAVAKMSVRESYVQPLLREMRQREIRSTEESERTLQSVSGPMEACPWSSNVARSRSCMLFRILLESLSS